MKNLYNWNDVDLCDLKLEWNSRILIELLNIYGGERIAIIECNGVMHFKIRSCSHLNASFLLHELVIEECKFEELPEHLTALCDSTENPDRVFVVRMEGGELEAEIVSIGLKVE